MGTVKAPLLLKFEHYVYCYKRTVDRRKVKARHVKTASHKHVNT